MFVKEFPSESERAHVELTLLIASYVIFFNVTLASPPEGETYRKNWFLLLCRNYGASMWKLLRWGC